MRGSFARIGLQLPVNGSVNGPAAAETTSVRQGLQIAQQSGASAVQLVQTLSRIAERDDVLHGLLVQAAIRVPRRQPLASG